MGKKIVFILFVVVFLLTPRAVFANATPVYIENYPGFSIAPMLDSPIKVDRETLTFTVDKQVSELATVTATYTISNSTAEKLTVPMVFPFVSEGFQGDAANIKFDGEAVNYQVYNAGHVDVRDYLREKIEFKAQVHIDTIIEHLNQPHYEAKYFDDKADTVLYEVTFKEPIGRQSRITFDMDTEKTRVLTFGFSGFDMSESGDCAVLSYVGDNNIGEKGYILVLGEDTLANIQADYNDVITQSMVTSNVFIRDKLEHNEDGWFNTENRDMENLYALFLKEVDSFWANFQLVFSHDMVMENMLYKNNISVLLYEVEFAGSSTTDLTVTYPMRATIDREKSQDYVNTFAYIVNPAQNFREFGGIDINIELNSSSPFIIESSLPLAEVEPGVYAASLDGLPEEDLVFSTYTSEEITFLDRTAAQILPRGYGAMLLGFMVVAILVVGTVAIALVGNKKRKE